MTINGIEESELPESVLEKPDFFYLNTHWWSVVGPSFRDLVDKMVTKDFVVQSSHGKPDDVVKSAKGHVSFRWTDDVIHYGAGARYENPVDDYSSIGEIMHIFLKTEEIDHDYTEGRGIEITGGWDQ